jgi:hypothetical protein
MQKQNINPSLYSFPKYQCVFLKPTGQGIPPQVAFPA